jgi:hypothetical protein
MIAGSQVSHYIILVDSVVMFADGLVRGVSPTMAPVFMKHANHLKLSPLLMAKNDFSSVQE